MVCALSVPFLSSLLCYEYNYSRYAVSIRFVVTNKLAPPPTAEEANWGGGTTPHTVPLLQAAAMADATSAEREVEALEEIQRSVNY